MGHRKTAHYVPCENHVTILFCFDCSCTCIMYSCCYEIRFDLIWLNHLLLYFNLCPQCVEWLSMFLWQLQTVYKIYVTNTNPQSFVKPKTAGVCLFECIFWHILVSQIFVEYTVRFIEQIQYMSSFWVLRRSDQEWGSWVTSGHMADHWKTSYSFRVTADDDDL